MLLGFGDNKNGFYWWDSVTKGGLSIRDGNTKLILGTILLLL